MKQIHIDYLTSIEDRIASAPSPREVYEALVEASGYLMGLKNSTIIDPNEHTSLLSMLRYILHARTDSLLKESQAGEQTEPPKV